VCGAEQRKEEGGGGGEGVETTNYLLLMSFVESMQAYYSYSMPSKYNCLEN
jgi:hypothetical protein